MACFSVFPVERRDFSPDAIQITIPPDEDGMQEVDFDVPVPIVDDEINEPEELFIIVLSVESSLNSDGLTVNPTRRSSLCRIFDNDGRLAYCHVGDSLYILVVISCKDHDIADSAIFLITCCLICLSLLVSLVLIQLYW